MWNRTRFLIGMEKNAKIQARRDEQTLAKTNKVTSPFITRTSITKIRYIELAIESVIPIFENRKLPCSVALNKALKLSTANTRGT
jgi:hypothetical protein